MHANMGIREMKKEEGVEDEGDSVGRGGAVGKRSRLSFQCEEVEGETQQNMCFQMFRKRRKLIHNTVTQTHTHTAYVSVSSCTVLSVRTNMCWV